MKPETAAFFAKARGFLDRAPALLAQDFTDDAGRAACPAGFQAAQALMFENPGPDAQNPQRRSIGIRPSGES